MDSVMPAISRRRSRHSNRTIEPERLVYIPERYWTEHEFCFYLHDQMLQLLSEYEASGAHRWVANAFQQALADSGNSDTDIDMLQILKAQITARCGGATGVDEEIVLSTATPMMRAAKGWRTSILGGKVLSP